MKRTLSLPIGVLLTLLLLLSTTASATAWAAGEPTLTGPNVQWRDTSHLPRLQDAKRVLLVGKKSGEAYLFDFSVHKGPSDRLVRVLRPIAVDSTRGLLLVEVGDDPNPGPSVPSGTATVTDVPKQSSLSGRNLGVPRVIGPAGAVITAARTTSTASFKAQLTDPPGLVVNSVTSTLTWNWDNFSAEYFSGSGTRTWLTASGWIEGGYSGPWHTISSSEVKVWYDDAHFVNPVFSSVVTGKPGITYADYYRITVIGRADGSRDGYGQALASGDLSWMLSASYRLE